MNKNLLIHVGKTILHGAVAYFSTKFQHNDKLVSCLHVAEQGSLVDGEYVSTYIM